ncbi:MAG TPA: class D sortase [candidate division Zixibacteria bacterium]|nr:class D sortase [candidate division Zixibacteria bacterium]
MDDFSVKELEQLLYRKKRRQRIHRLQRLKADGRIVEVSGLPSPDSQASQPGPRSPGAIGKQMCVAHDGESEPAALTDQVPLAHPHTRWCWLADKTLLLIEVIIIIGLIAIGISLWGTRTELNQELAKVLRAESQSLALPTPAATPIIDVVILPGGHKPPIDGRIPKPGEAGDIPEHLLPVINTYKPPPIPTPGPEQARRIQIPAIDVDSPIVQGMYDWEQLKKGVAQRIGSASPGMIGNIALAGHNDIYGEIFRNLDKLLPGDEIIVSTQRRNYTYVVRDTKVVEPTDVWVLEPTEFASATLVSCYPYRVNTKRIAVFADLASI